jgi:hypothetical protein
MNREKREAFVMEAVYKELDLAGVDHSVLKSDEQWYQNNTMTPEQHKEWKKWFIAESRKIFKLTKKGAEQEFQYFDLSYGLRIHPAEQI